MFTTNTWSTQKLSWLYAAITALLVAIGFFLLIHHELIEIFDLRIVYVVLILLGILGFSTKVAIRSEESISFINAFKLCFKTGIFMFTILFSIIIVIYMTAPNFDAIKQGSLVSKDSYQARFYFSMGIEVFAIILMSALIAAFIPKLIQKSK